MPSQAWRDTHNHYYKTIIIVYNITGKEHINGILHGRVERLFFFFLSNEIRESDAVLLNDHRLLFEMNAKGKRLEKSDSP